MKNFFNKVDNIIKKDNRYKKDAYEFVMHSLWYTQVKYKKQGHITGKELLGGIRDLAIDKFGPMAKTVLGYWGIEKTDDFGCIVFNMIEAGLLSKTETDNIDDFKNVFDFDETFNIFKNNSFDKLSSTQKLRNSILKQKASASKPYHTLKDFGKSFN